MGKQARMDKTAAKEAALLERVKALLEDGKLAMAFQPEDEDEEAIFASLNLLTAKPVIYAANVSEDDLADDGASNAGVAAVREYAAESGSGVLSSVPRSKRRSPNWRRMKRLCSLRILA